MNQRNDEPLYVLSETEHKERLHKEREAISYHDAKEAFFVLIKSAGGDAHFFMEDRRYDTFTVHATINQEDCFGFTYDRNGYTVFVPECDLSKITVPTFSMFAEVFIELLNMKLKSKEEKPA